MEEWICFGELPEEALEAHLQLEERVPPEHPTTKPLLKPRLFLKEFFHHLIGCHGNRVAQIH
ncbi:hypothetical protein [Ruegeria faecimaris]|uniref:hypothetical protein n=1 Tax=Ruegeria faecimaris TaxID=686389 RepID=UPI00249146BC|nr:hypothetical protein [Ruegeria faecimaris]